MISALSFAIRLLFISGMLLRSAIADGGASPAETLFEVSGLEQQMQQVSTAIGQGYDSAGMSDFAGRQLSQESLDRIRAGMVRAFDAQRLSAVVKSTLAKEMSDAEIQSAIAWHRSELGSRITAFETARSHLTQSADRARFVQSLRSDPPGQARLAALEELSKAWHSTETSVSMMIDMQVAVSAAMMTYLPQDQRTSIASLIEIYESQRDALSQHYASDTLWSMLYVYAELSTSQIKLYTQYASSPHGQRYVDAANLALHKAMLEGSYALGQELGFELGRDAENAKALPDSTSM